MKRILAIAAPLLLIATTATAGTILGFSPDRAEEQARLETAFDQHLDRDEIREWIRRVSARPHYLGSAHGKANETRLWSDLEGQIAITAEVLEGAARLIRDAAQVD